MPPQPKDKPPQDSTHSEDSGAAHASNLPLSVDAEGWVNAAVCVPSPNCDERADPEDISLLVIHNISLPPGEFENGCVQQFFCNQLDHAAHPFFQEIVGLEVSSHFFISRQGALTQFVPVGARAWHAGASTFNGRERCNDFSIGIELEGTDEQPYTDQQYACLQRLTDTLMRHYPAISVERITGHSDISPGRKTDPGPAFDWPRYLDGLASR
ncbi:1,6-anhydro-N-acetylmuramyl-L-alanine amidase AmpD [Aestuariicella hydrocarbonica]|uniref:1,6-anhydro-N-acetylmuramyl-L-alanine amidase AmpD n=1 Tax=Pseudomaricurvus hydrocarbonicus TaxID=1470433 RepID=A0A9E5JRC6_9GAMM|nr:1,6-anhydro-N-acetylmuramyl-L-alanine amidase AmpD [Aestuariicella hydrocarbonica]NHO65114.1 1,6-anhydro-N-acetylmuramyl-L-alanine amidase AmpD [Aestuariicella hydrocarbonica]